MTSAHPGPLFCRLGTAWTMGQTAHNKGRSTEGEVPQLPGATEIVRPGRPANPFPMDCFWGWVLPAMYVILGVSAVQAASLPTIPGSPGEVISEVAKVAAAQQHRLPAYSVTRRYTVSNRHLARPAVLVVEWNYAPGTGKRFRILSGEGMSGVTRDAVVKLLNDEAAAGGADSHPSSVTADHYSFELADDDENRYKIRVTPKEKNKYLLNGYAYVNRTASAIARLEGRTSKRVSFWVGEADVIQEFAEYSGYWLPSRTQSTANVRFVGRTELTIEAGEYQFHPVYTEK